MARAAKSSDDEIAMDLSCVQCGYNLRRLPRAGQCPECGRAIRDSIAAAHGPRISRKDAHLALLLIAPAPSLGAYMMFWSHRGEALGSAAYAIGKVILYGLPIVWLLFVDRQRFSLSKPVRGGLGVGAALGIIISAAIFAVFYFFAKDRIDPAIIQDVVATNGLSEPWKYVAACAWLAAVNALLEEYSFRWFIYTRCEALMRPLLAILLAGLVFTAHHIIVLKAYFEWDITLLASAGILIGGCAWSALYLRYRSIWPGYVSHVIVDVAVFAIGWDLIFGS